VASVELKNYPGHVELNPDYIWPF